MAWRQEGIKEKNQCNIIESLSLNVLALFTVPNLFWSHTRWMGMSQAIYNKNFKPSKKQLLSKGISRISLNSAQLQQADTACHCITYCSLKSMREAGAKNTSKILGPTKNPQYVVKRPPSTVCTLWGKTSSGIAVLLKLERSCWSVYLNDQCKINVKPLSIYPVNNLYSILIFKIQHHLI